jgi:hypothetical protein
LSYANSMPPYTQTHAHPPHTPDGNIYAYTHCKAQSSAERVLTKETVKTQARFWRKWPLLIPAPGIWQQVGSAAHRRGPVQPGDCLLSRLIYNFLHAVLF